MSNTAVYNPLDSILKLDVMKACNFVSGHSIKAAIEELPGSRKDRLVQYFNLLYCFGLDMFTHGSVSAKASIGVLQGCPLSLFVFCLALSPALSAAASFLPANGVNAYPDDCTLQGLSSAIVRAFQAFTDTAAKAHLYP